MWRLGGQVRFSFLLSVVDTRGGRCLARFFPLFVRRIGVVSIKTGTRNMWDVECGVLNDGQPPDTERAEGGGERE